MNDREFFFGSKELSDKDYKDLWGKLNPIQIKMIEMSGSCKHNIKDTYIYTNPYEKPEGVCSALLHVLDLYTWRVALGFPSWEQDDRTVYRIHCPSKKGTIWEMKKLIRP